MQLEPQGVQPESFQKQELAAAGNIGQDKSNKETLHGKGYSETGLCKEGK